MKSRLGKVGQLADCQSVRGFGAGRRSNRMIPRASQVSKLQVDPQHKRFRRAGTRHEILAVDCLAMIKFAIVRIWSRLTSARINMPADSC